MKSQRVTISVSGAAEIAHCGPSVIPIAKELGREIARQGAQIVTGATSGFPLYAAEKLGVKVQWPLPIERGKKL